MKSPRPVPNHRGKGFPVESLRWEARRLRSACSVMADRPASPGRPWPDQYHWHPPARQCIRDRVRVTSRRHERKSEQDQGNGVCYVHKTGHRRRCWNGGNKYVPSDAPIGPNRRDPRTVSADPGPEGSKPPDTGRRLASTMAEVGQRRIGSAPPGLIAFMVLRITATGGRLTICLRGSVDSGREP